jgi:hypothetical protein
MYREGREGNPLSRESYPRYYRKRLSRRDPLKARSQQEEANPALSILVVWRRPNSPSYRRRTSRKVGVMIGILEDYEAGYLDTRETLELFAELIRTGGVWNLGNPYLNQALYLIDAGYITSGGKITNKGRTMVLNEGREGSPCDVNPQIVVGAFDDPIPGPVAIPNV